MMVRVIIGTALAAITLPGTVELLALTLAGLLPPRRRVASGTARTLRVAVVIPSHNEELNIGRCLLSLKAANRSGIDLTMAVIADNCTDRTADVAAKFGGRVLVRYDADLRGKGYALDFAFRTLLPEGHEVFIVVDADSEVASNFLSGIASVFRSGGQAAQCRYVVRNGADSTRTRLMNVALLAFNVLRPRGRDRMGLSAGIFGNGFALSSETLRAVPYTASSVVEDLEYHVALVRAGRRVEFVDGTSVYGDMPVAGAGVGTQRARWEGGRFRMIVDKVPRLALEALGGKWRLCEPCLDLMLLPLAFHVTLLLAALLVQVATWSIFPAAIALAGLGVVALHLAAAIRVGGGGMRDIAVLAAAPFYVIWKLMLVPRLIRSSRSGTAWVRTERAPHALNPKEKRTP
jgi:cellulose synthase/poly-beta-1,6-N-acetylglucosamine synthase-like glycosyltransferase